MLVSVQEFSNIPLEHTPDPQPTVYEGIPFIWGFGDVWGMLQGYVEVFLDSGRVTQKVLVLAIDSRTFPGPSAWEHKSIWAVTIWAPGYELYMRDYTVTTQLYRDYNKPLQLTWPMAKL